MATLKIESVLEQLALADKDVLDIFILGSRMWGTERAGSDYDLLITVKKLPSHLLGKTGGERCTRSFSLRGVGIDVLLTSFDSLRERLAIAKYPDILTFFVPEDCILRQSKEFLKLRQSFELKQELLAASAATVVSKEWPSAQQLIETGDLERGKKVLGHIMRLLSFYEALTSQMADSSKQTSIALGEVDVDIRGFNEVHEELRGTFARDWTHYEEMCLAERDRCLQVLSAGV